MTCPPPGDLPDPGIEPRSPALQADSLSSELAGELVYTFTSHLSVSSPHLLVDVYQFGFPGGSDGKESACNAGDLHLIPGMGRALEEGMATTLVFLPG